MTERPREPQGRSPRAEEQTSASNAYLPEARDLASLREGGNSCRACASRGSTRRARSSARVARRRAPLSARRAAGRRGRLAAATLLGPAGRLLDADPRRSGARPGQRLPVQRREALQVRAAGEAPAALPAQRGRSARLPRLARRGLAAVRPRVVVCLGATAARSLLGRTFSLTRSRGEPMLTAAAPW